MGDVAVDASGHVQDFVRTSRWIRDARPPSPCGQRGAARRGGGAVYPGRPVSRRAEPARRRDKNGSCTISKIGPRPRTTDQDILTTGNRRGPEGRPRKHRGGTSDLGRFGAEGGRQASSSRYRRPLDRKSVG